MKPENIKLLKFADKIIKVSYVVILGPRFIDLFIVIMGGTPGSIADTSIVIPLTVIIVVHFNILKVLKSEQEETKSGNK